MNKYLLQVEFVLMGKTLCWVVDHLSPAHKEALHLKQLDKVWNNTSDSHHWVKVMKNYKPESEISFMPGS